MSEAAPETPVPDETTQATSDDKPKDEKEAAKRGYSYATKVVREENKQRFLELQTQWVRENGFPQWKPTPTKEEKAEQQLLDLLREHPHLVDRAADIAGKVGLDQVGQQQVASVTERA